MSVCSHSQQSNFFNFNKNKISNSKLQNLDSSVMSVDIKIYLIHLQFLCSEEEGKVVSILTHFTLFIFYLPLSQQLEF
jgi:hypothetical protein